jgi:hypothetical protein
VKSRDAVNRTQETMQKMTGTTTSTRKTSIRSVCLTHERRRPWVGTEHRHRVWVADAASKPAAGDILSGTMLTNGHPSLDTSTVVNLPQETRRLALQKKHNKTDLGLQRLPARSVY